MALCMLTLHACAYSYQLYTIYRTQQARIKPTEPLMADWAMEDTHDRIEDKTGCEVLDHVQQVRRKAV